MFCLWDLLTDRDRSWWLLQLHRRREQAAAVVAVEEAGLLAQRLQLPALPQGVQQRLQQAAGVAAAPEVNSSHNKSGPCYSNTEFCWDRLS